ncbi:hypothetical protein ULMA_31160 [Patiriisocius marinus]|uniref:Uncharacterized protein n=1 Tax=Patiriisocius marinus TaxID=1397112 RepID=A0A5J4J4Q0_9FLAO|nr:hypothetical protein [Patiriisocius marinus]GER61008.1 hypothetical protein ULMA_31160 [Patiriisocius marinus]
MSAKIYAVITSPSASISTMSEPSRAAMASDAELYSTLVQGLYKSDANEKERF